ncbi:MAG TPA: diacylglycerol kinase family protein, partial [Actinomycetes bacterium]|nr:diacylglycerol kinase family protein [Actinomycetes bacterium]
EEARRRGIEPVVLAPGDDLLRLAEQAVAGGADVVGMAGGDGSQALVAGVAARHGVGFVCVPAGTRNHLAMDLGLDRGDVAGALDAFGPAVERRIDLGLVGERVFVNNATVGLYAKIVQSPAYRDRKVGTALELLPTMVGPDATPFDLRFTGPDGTEHASAHLILVSNDRYELGSGEGFGSRRRIDLGMAGERVFVNNATAGLYAKIVQSPAYRERKVGTALELLPTMLGPGATPLDLRFTGPDGTEHPSAHLILVSNDRYELGSGEGFGSRRRIDAGNLGIVAATFRTSGEIARLIESEAAGRSWRPPGWVEWADTTFRLHSSQPVEIGIDGEALVLDPPIEFRVLPRALRVRIPRGAPGYSPAAAAPTRGWATVTALLRSAAGRPVALGSS